MKKFFLLSGTGRLRRRKYALYALLIAVAEVLVEHEIVSPGLGAIIGLVCLVGWIYIISARLHDLGYAGWRAWVWLGLQLLPLLGEGFTIITTLGGLFIGLTLLFTKGVEEDNEYGPSHYKHENEQVEEIIEKKEKIKKKANESAKKGENKKVEGKNRIKKEKVIKNGGGTKK